MQTLVARFLALLERLLKIDVQYALSGGFFLGLTQVTSAIVALGLTIAFANLLPVETYGTYRYVLAVYALLAIAALPGLETSMMQSVARRFDSSFKRSIFLKLRWGLLGALASFLYAGYLYSQGSMVMGHVFLLVGVALPFMESFALSTAFLNTKKLYPVSATVDIIAQGISIASLVCVMLITKNIIALMLGYFAPYIVVRLIVTWHVARTHAAKSEDDPGLLKYGQSMTLFQVVSRLIASADQIVLYHLLGPAQVAIFSLATAIPNRVQSLLRITGTLAFPKVAVRTGQEMALSLPRKMLIFGCGILAICAAYIVAAPLIFTYIFPQYLPSLVYSQAAIFFTLSSITYPFGSFLMAHKKVQDTYIMAIGGFITKITCLVGLVPFFGIWGAVIGLLATATVTILLTVWMLIRERNSPNSGSESGDLSQHEPVL